MTDVTRPRKGCPFPRTRLQRGETPSAVAEALSSLGEPEQSRSDRGSLQLVKSQNDPLSAAGTE